MPKLWSPASPTLYAVEAFLSGAVSDRVTDRFGFRAFGRATAGFPERRALLYVGALDQDFYPDTIYTAPGRLTWST